MNKAWGAEFGGKLSLNNVQWNMKCNFHDQRSFQILHEVFDKVRQKNLEILGGLDLRSEDIQILFLSSIRM